MNAFRDHDYTLDDVAVLCRNYGRKVEIGYDPQRDGSRIWFVRLYAASPRVTADDKFTGNTLQEAMMQVFTYCYLDDVPDEVKARRKGSHDN